jgi:Dolichyl-phosphate-mannose-protein mannosyltransferase
MGPPISGKLYWRSPAFWTLAIGERQHLVLGLGLLLVLEVALYSRSFSMFFCGDSLYYLSRQLASLADVVRIFTTVDHLEEYRPLPFILFSFVYYPLFKLDPFGYHFIPLLFHMLNTYLVFRLTSKLLNSNLGAYIATFYFGTHSVNFFITYDMTMLTDFTYAFLYLLAVLFFLRYLEKKKTVWMAGAIVAFATSLLAKEAAITLLATATVSAIVYLGKNRDEESLSRLSIHIIKKAWPLFAVALIYLTILLTVKGGNLYPQRSAHPYHAILSLSSLVMKYTYLQWGFNLPDGLAWNREALDRLRLAAALAPFVGLFGIFLGRGIWARDKIVWCGVIWFVAGLSPVLFLPNFTMAHCLYVPNIGLGLIFGSLAETAFRSKKHQILVVAAMLIFVAANLSASWANGARYLSDSWLSNGSRAAQIALDDMKNIRPELPPDATLYFMKSIEKDFPWFFDYGKLFNIFLDKPPLKSLFADHGAKLPSDYMDDPKLVILRFVRPHLYDVTEEFRAEMRDDSSIKLLPLLRNESVSFNRGELYLRYDVFETPTAKPVFIMPMVRGNAVRESLVTIAGARVRFDIPPIENNSRLAFGITTAFDAGDGAEGQIYFEHDGTRDLLYSHWLNPAQNEDERRWLDWTLDLSKYSGKKGSLVFECNSGPNGNPVADWMVWSGMKILRGSRMLPDSGVVPLPNPLGIQVNPTALRLGEYVILSLEKGSHMTIDCKYRLNGETQIRQRWFTTSSVGQYVFKPVKTGKWEIVAIKNSLNNNWVQASAAFTVN